MSGWIQATMQQNTTIAWNKIWENSSQYDLLFSKNLSVGSLKIFSRSLFLFLPCPQTRKILWIHKKTTTFWSEVMFLQKQCFKLHWTIINFTQSIHKKTTFWSEVMFLQKRCFKLHCTIINFIQSNAILLNFLTFLDAILNMMCLFWAGERAQKIQCVSYY